MAMLSYVLVAVIVVAAAGVVLAWFGLRIRASNRIPSLNTLRDVTRRGAQRTTLRARTNRSSEEALNGMLSDLK
ncbi:MAG: hypothetical protein EON57_10815 [Alphaproteobacteria bacterium]|nr:MAG: hypothetical protein EON57_10815 [Alphaproteobacteria bacterium]